MSNVKKAGDDEFIRAITWLTKRYGYPPTMREVAHILGYESVSTVKYRLDRLRNEGRVRWTPRTPRSLRVVS